MYPIPAYHPLTRGAKIRVSWRPVLRQLFRDISLTPFPLSILHFIHRNKRFIFSFFSPHYCRSKDVTISLPYMLFSLFRNENLRIISTKCSKYASGLSRRLDTEFGSD